MQDGMPLVHGGNNPSVPSHLRRVLVTADATILEPENPCTDCPDEVESNSGISDSIFLASPPWVFFAVGFILMVALLIASDKRA